MAVNRIFIGLGSNQGNSQALLHSALRELSTAVPGGCERVSSLYRTTPVGYTKQPDFLNAVALFRDSRDPHEWLQRLLTVEAGLGRRRHGRRWGPRTIDLDLLAVEDWILTTPQLTLPHPRVQERRFVLIPWAEIAPNFRLPDGRRIEAILATCPEIGQVARVQGPDWCQPEEHLDRGAASKHGKRG